MDTLCFFYDKIIISCFYGLLFLIFNALLFSFVKFKLYTYHNCCLTSDLTKIKRLIILYYFPQIVSLFLFFKCKLKIDIFSHSFSFSFEVTK